jgi:hypothetical protein
MLTWRTGTICGQGPPPCDKSEGDAIVDGGNADFVVHLRSSTEAIGYVTSTTDPQTVPIGKLTATLSASQDVIFLQPSPTGDLPFCGQRAITSNISC